jgi:RHS repeat-associated protein
MRIKRDGTIRHYKQDALGSVIGLLDDTGIPKTGYTYDPFGSVIITGEASDNPFQYTGRENDGTGLYYYRGRYYSPELQRFISEDPILRPISSKCLRGGSGNGFVWVVPFLIKNPQSLHPYNYTDNNPVNATDPLGLEPCYKNKCYQRCSPVCVPVCYSACVVATKCIFLCGPTCATACTTSCSQWCKCELI